MKLIWSQGAWDEYVDWQARDSRMVKKINALLRDIMRGGDAGQGIGKPELLHGDLAGWAARRITQEHRLVYRVVNGSVEIAACRYHYS